VLQLGQIDRADDKPPYRQIASMLRGAISSGQLEAGGRLPSEAELIEHFGVARMTVRQAVQELRAEGLVISEHGRGVFVRPAHPIASRGNIAPAAKPHSPSKRRSPATHPRSTTSP
jgi:GntR family transcriptional regulator